MNFAEAAIIVNSSGTFTLTLQAASGMTGRQLWIKAAAANAVANSNVVPLAGGAAGTAILTGTAGKYVLLHSYGTNWIIMAAN